MDKSALPTVNGTGREPPHPYRRARQPPNARHRPSRQPRRKSRSQWSGRDLYRRPALLSSRRRFHPGIGPCTRYHGFQPRPGKSRLVLGPLPRPGTNLQPKLLETTHPRGRIPCLIYATNWNARYFNDYSTAYRDAMDNDPNTNSFINFLAYNRRNDPEWIAANMAWLQSAMKRQKRLLPEIPRPLYHFDDRRLLCSP